MIGAHAQKIQQMLNVAHKDESRATGWVRDVRSLVERSTFAEPGHKEQALLGLDRAIWSFEGPAGHCNGKPSSTQPKSFFVDTRDVVKFGGGDVVA